MKRAQRQRLVVEHAAGLGIGGQEGLEAAIETEAIHLVGPHAASGRIRGLEDEDLGPSLMQVPGAREPGDPAADDHDLGHAPSSRPSACSSCGARQ